MSETRIYIVEDHPFMRDTLKAYLNATSGLEVVGVAASAEEAREGLPSLQADLLLIDVSLPGTDGLSFAAEVTQHRSDLACLILSGHHQQTYLERARKARVSGYVQKGDPDVVVEAIRAVASGQSYWVDEET